MVSIIKRKKGNNTYYYLAHNSGKRQHERYLGKQIPQDLELISQKFEDKVFSKENVPLLEDIKRNYSEFICTADPKIIKSEHYGFKINHIYSTQRIEGSTMTYNQTRKLLEYNLSPKDTLTEHIIEAQQMLKIFDELLISKDDDISKKLILNWHEKLFERTDTNNAGSFRRQDVQPYMGKTEYVLWMDVIESMDKLVKWYNKNKKLANPVVLSATFHRKFELIHPFIDGNGRIGRLLMLFILYKNRYPMMNILPKEKNTYINKLESSYLKDNPLVFVKWFTSKYLRENKKYL